MTKNVRAVVADSKRGKRCAMCGTPSNGRRRSLHYHHRNPSEKRFNLSNPRGRTVEEVEEEIEKCALLCVRCHRDMHSSQDPSLALIEGVDGYATLHLLSGVGEIRL